MALVKYLTKKFTDDLQYDSVQAVNDSELPKTRGFARMCTCTCTIVPLLFSLTFCILYGQMWNQALKFNNDAEDSLNASD